MTVPPGGDAIVDLVPFLLVGDVKRSIRFYEALGFTVVKRYAPQGRLEFAGLRSTSAAKVMLARVDEVPKTGPDAQTPGYLYLYTPDLMALRTRLLDLEIQVDDIEDGPGPGPNRQMCVRDPDGHGHMIAELWPDSIADDPRPSVGPIGRLLARVRPPGRPRPNRARVRQSGAGELSVRTTRVGRAIGSVDSSEVGRTWRAALAVRRCARSRGA